MYEYIGITGLRFSQENTYIYVGKKHKTQHKTKLMGDSKVVCKHHLCLVQNSVNLTRITI